MIQKYRKKGKERWRNEAQFGSRKFGKSDSKKKRKDKQTQRWSERSTWESVRDQKQVREEEVRINATWASEHRNEWWMLWDVKWVMKYEERMLACTNEICKKTCVCIKVCNQRNRIVRSSINERAEEASIDNEAALHFKQWVEI